MTGYNDKKKQKTKRYEMKYEKWKMKNEHKDDN